MKAQRETFGVGIVGCGKISGTYFENLTNMFSDTAVVACSDLDQERAAVKAAEFGAEAMTTELLLQDERVDLVLNLTTPQHHASLNAAAIAAGKHVYVEKPLAVTLADGEASMARAEAAGVRLGCAPDTFLGGGIQACRKLIDDGAIGEVTSCLAFMTCPGHESWHPDPEFYYLAGGGPMLDMGPYYLTALVNLVGPIAAVSAMTGQASPTRTITSEKKRGTVIPVEVPTHQSGSIRFASGAIGTMVMSFDVGRSDTPRIEIHGTEGTLSVPDPNSFGGPIKLASRGGDWKDVEIVSHGYTENGRGIGVAEMAQAIRDDRPHRVSGQLALHVLDVMLAFEAASDRGATVTIESPCERPEALPVGTVF